MSVCENEELMIIIYVKDQEKSKIFYEQLLGYAPRLNVPGMTEFKLTNNGVLGIMPEEGIVRILENKIVHPKTANGIPRSEIYFFVHNPDEYYTRLVSLGGSRISKVKLRNWGHNVAYGADIDGHILAFAKKAE